MTCPDCQTPYSFFTERMFGRTFEQCRCGTRLLTYRPPVPVVCPAPRPDPDARPFAPIASRGPYRRRNAKIDRNAALVTYYATHSMADCAEYFGISVGAVFSALKHMGVQRRSRGERVA